MAGFDQLLDELQHPRDVLRGARIMFRRLDVEPVDVVEERFGVVSRDVVGRLVLQACRNEHLVFAAVEGVVGEVAHVGDVHHLLGLVPEVLQTAAQEVGQHEGAQIPDVHVAVDGGAAGVEPDDAFLERLQILFGPREGVVQANLRQLHAASILSIGESPSP